MSDVTLEQVIKLALQLSIADRIQLLEHIAAAVRAKELEEEQELTQEELDKLLTPNPKTSAEIAEMLSSPEWKVAELWWTGMMFPHITDPVK